MTSTTKSNNKKYFVIINSNFIGDILLTSCLIQNIKRLYKDSFIIMVTTSEKTVEVAKGVEFVDDVVLWERKGKHKGIIGMLKFAKSFPYKDIFAVILLKQPNLSAEMPVRPPPDIGFFGP